MPSFEDYDKEEEQQRAGGGGSRGGMGGGGGGGAQIASATPQHESSFVPWSRFVSANQDVAQRGANALNSQVSNDVGSAKKGLSDASDAFGSQIESNYRHEGDAPAPTAPTARQPQVNPNSAPAGNPFSSFGKPGQGFGGDKATDGQPAAAPASVDQQARLGVSSAPAPAPAPAADPLEAMKHPSTMSPGGMPGTQTSLFAGPQPGNRIGHGQANDQIVNAGLTDSAIANPQGSKDLESMMGADAWGKLMGQTTKAQSEAGALGSQTGTQGLIQQQSGQPLAQNGAFDAALEYGQGQKAFGDTSKSGANLSGDMLKASQSSQNQWHSLMGDVDEAKRQQGINAEADAANKQIQGNIAGQAAKTEAQTKADAQGVQDAWDSLTANQADKAYSAAAGPGGVNGIGSKDSFMDALKWGGGYATGQDHVDGAWSSSDALYHVAGDIGMNQQQALDMFNSMTPQQWQQFWWLGVIPVGTKGVDPSKCGKVGGWNSPFAQGPGKYHDQGGMVQATGKFIGDSAKGMGEAAAAIVGA